MTFADLQLDALLQRAVAEEGYTIPTPIQEAAIGHILAGKDLLGCAQTGTGKTAAFALPILQKLLREPAAPMQTRRPIRTLILAPTRELAGQILESFQAYGRHTKLRYAVIFGGVNQNPQVAALKIGVDVLIATPGRLLDLMGQGHVDLSKLHHFVLDEADNMLDMGFIHDIRRILPKIPPRRQTLLFSATMPREIRELADTILHEPVSVKVAPVSSAAETVEQCVYFIEKADKPRLLSHYLKGNNTERVLVFARTKHGADRVVKYLVRDGITALAIHGNKSMNARKRAMTHFKSEAPPVLVATDIAARGLDIDAVSHVINYDLPNVAETYIHRIGRTGRAGASGLAVSFCDREERAYLRDIEKLMKKSVPVQPLPADMPQQPKTSPHFSEPRPEARPPQGPSGRPHAAPGAAGHAATSPALRNEPHPYTHPNAPQRHSAGQPHGTGPAHNAQRHGAPQHQPHRPGARLMLGQGAGQGHPRISSAAPAPRARHTQPAQGQFQQHGSQGARGTRAQQGMPIRGTGQRSPQAPTGFRTQQGSRPQQPAGQGGTPRHHEALPARGGSGAIRRRQSGFVGR